jgi:hypothetical protein
MTVGITTKQGVPSHVPTTETPTLPYECVFNWHLLLNGGLAALLKWLVGK